MLANRSCCRLHFVHRLGHLGNGRFARKVFQEVTERHARRVADRLSAGSGEVSTAELSTLTRADLPDAAAPLSQM